MEDIATILKPFDEATTSLSGQYYSTISIIIPMFQALKNSLQENPNDSFLAACLRG